MMQKINTHEENFIHTLESSKRKDRERLSLVMVKPKFKITWPTNDGPTWKYYYIQIIRPFTGPN